LDYSTSVKQLLWLLSYYGAYSRVATIYLFDIDLAVDHAFSPNDRIWREIPMLEEFETHVHKAMSERKG
jgi:hypothetical protein